MIILFSFEVYFGRVYNYQLKIHQFRPGYWMPLGFIWAVVLTISFRRVVLLSSLQAFEIQRILNLVTRKWSQELANKCVIEQIQT